MNQLALNFTARGETFDPERDGARLGGLYARCRDYVLSHEWVTLRELSDACGGSESSVSARLRDMRARGLYVETKYVSKGLWAYKVTRS